jgi:hypothetical protein
MKPPRRVALLAAAAAAAFAQEAGRRPLDIAVDKPVGEGLANKDSQLDAAVRELVRQLDGPKGGATRN